MIPLHEDCSADLIRETSEATPGNNNDVTPISNEKVENLFPNFSSLSEVSTLGILFYCIIAGICLIITIIFINVDHQNVSHESAQVVELGGFITISSTLSHTKGILIGISILSIILYIVFAIFAVWYLRRISISIEGEMCQLYCSFDLLSNLHLENTPLYVNKHSDVDVITEKQTFLLEIYSNQLELQKTQDSINNISLILRQFRKSLPDTVFNKRSTGEVESLKREEKEFIKPFGVQSTENSKNITWSGLIPSSRKRAISQLDNENEICMTLRRKDSRRVVMLSHDGTKKIPDKDCSYKTLNISEIRGGVESGLKKRKVTVVVASLSGFALHVDEDLRCCLYLSERFFAIVTEIADRYGGTVLSVTPDKLIVVWNAFSDSSNHEKSGMQYACDTIAALEIFTIEIVNSMLMRLTPIVVATSGYVLAGTVGAEEERAMSVYGGCVALAEELPSLLISLGIKCACIGALSESCPSFFSCIPMDFVTDADNNQHIIYEVIENPIPYHNKLTEAFEKFRNGNYDVAEIIYSEAYNENCMGWQAFRMSQLCSYLKKSGRVYQRCIPKWQLFSIELEETNTTTMERRMSSYHWRKPESSSVEDQIRRAILKRSDNYFKSSSSYTEGNKEKISNLYNKENNSGHHLSPIFIPQSAVTEFRDRQGMIFRMSDRILGIGAHGSVSMGLSQTGALVAIKSIELPMIRNARSTNMTTVNRRRLCRKGINVEGNVEEALDSIINEVSLLSRLRHSNIVGYISSSVLDNKLLVVMELASGGSLYNMMRQITNIKVNRAKRYLRDVLKGLAYLHRKNIVHRDIKPQNVLLLENGLCKLSDFGTSQSLQKISNSTRLEGTPPYISPEAAQGKAEKASDIWSFGIMMAQILSGNLPWPDAVNMAPHAFLYNIGHVDNFIPQVDDKISIDAKEIIMRCCNRTPSKRPTARELLGDSYFCLNNYYVNSTALNRRSYCVDEHFQSFSLNGSQARISSDYILTLPSQGHKTNSLNFLPK